MPAGKVKWFNGERGYGLIAQENEGPDLLVYRAEVVELGFDEVLLPGERVAYEVRHTPEGLVAADVHRLDRLP